MSGLIEKFLQFEKKYFKRAEHISDLNASGLAPDDIIASMEILNDLRRGIVDDAKNFKPETDFWSAYKAVTDQLLEMPLFSEQFKDMFVGVYSQYAKDALSKSPFSNPRAMGKTREKQIDWAYTEAIEKANL